MQAGGRRFDPVQLHQSRAGGRNRVGGTESRSKRRSCPIVLLASGLLNQCYRLFFNNAEEVKQFLLDEREGRRKPPFRRVGRDGLDCIEPAIP